MTEDLYNMRASGFVGEFGSNKAEIENWIIRDTVDLRTRYEETIAGSARQYSLENVIELALMTAFVRSGIKPSSAAAYAAMAMRNHATESPNEWYIFVDGSKGDGHAVSDIPDGYIEDLMKESLTKTVSIIQVGAVIRKAEAVFRGE
jgi:hypothetical protein